MSACPKQFQLAPESFASHLCLSSSCTWSNARGFMSVGYFETAILVLLVADGLAPRAASSIMSSWVYSWSAKKADGPSSSASFSGNAQFCGWLLFCILNMAVEALTCPETPIGTESLGGAIVLEEYWKPALETSTALFLLNYDGFYPVCLENCSNCRLSGFFQLDLYLSS